MLRNTATFALKRHLWTLHLAATNTTFPNTSGQQKRLASSNPLKISHLDHLVLTVKDVDRTVEFYTSVLGMEATTFKGGRKCLNFGEQKINLHQYSKEFEPKAHTPTPGSADLCFITSTTLNKVHEHLKDCKIEVVEGPVERTGAVGAIQSLYIRDPDRNLIEISNYTNKGN